MSNCIWKPSLETIETTQMTQFMQRINEHTGLAMRSYADLYDWSIQHPAEFWEQLALFTQVKFSTPYTQVLDNPDKMPGAQWFPGAKLNFAQHLLRHNNSQAAIIFHNENGERVELSYAQLNTQVRRLAYQLRKFGVKIGDRVAGYLPNRPETIIAMLATTCLGAIWSSCSPDFGYHGVYDRFRQIEPKILFACDGHFYNGKAHDAREKVAQLCRELSSIEQVVVVANITQDPDIEKINKSMLFNELVSQPEAVSEFTETPFNHPLYILFSSGTTGVPKCIVHGAGGTLLQHLKELVLHTNLQSSDTITYFATCGWMMWNWLVSSLAVGATVVLYDGSPLHPHPGRLFDLIDAESISVFGTSAKYLSAIAKANLKPAQSHKLSHLRTILSTGSPLMPENYDYVYQDIKADLCLSSISGGTDIISCFALGNPNLPVYRGELQCRGLGMAVEVFNEQGSSIIGQKGELVCTKPFPSMPVAFWNDRDGKLYQHAYFDKFPHVWAHGDYAQITARGGVIIYGRSDTVLNPSGVRIGTAEIYREVEAFPEILESIVIGQPYENDVRVVLFVKLAEHAKLDNNLIANIRQRIKNNVSPHHVPKKIIAVNDIPRTLSGKIAELAVLHAVMGEPVKNCDALANPDALNNFRNLDELN